MKVEKIVAQKDDGTFFNYSILAYSNKKSDDCDLTLLVGLMRTNVLQDVLDYEKGITPYQYGSSDEWSVRYGDFKKSEKFYIEFYDFWAEQDATEIIYGASGLMFDKLKGLKIISRDNLFELIDFWQLIYKQKPEYIIITKDVNGWITLESMEKLSPEDLNLIEQEKKLKNLQ